MHKCECAASAEPILAEQVAKALKNIFLSKVGWPPKSSQWSQVVLKLLVLKLRMSRNAAASLLFTLGIYRGSLFADILLALFSAPFLEVMQVLFLKRKPTFENLILYCWSLIDCADGKFCCKHTPLITAQYHILLLSDFHHLRTNVIFRNVGITWMGNAKLIWWTKMSFFFDYFWKFCQDTWSSANKGLVGYFVRKDQFYRAN